MSSDRLPRIQQAVSLSASTSSEQDSASIRNLEERGSFGLFDNIAFESTGTSNNCYHIGQIVRMRRICGNRKTEYIKPVDKEKDKEKNLEIIVKMFNQHHTDENVYKVTRVTKIIKLNEIITHVQLSQDIDTWKLSLADTQYLENYFQGISRNYRSFVCRRRG